MESFFVELAKQSPAIGLLILFLFGFLKEWWYIGGPARQRYSDFEARLSACEKSKREWERRAISSLKLSEDAAWVAEQERRNGT